jgi:hypothetical protein
MPALSVLKNNVSTTVGPTGYVAGSGSLTLAPGGGSAFPSLAVGQYLRVTVIRAAFARVPSASPSTFTIFKVTAIAGDVLTIGGTFEGTLDRSYTAGDVVEMRLTAGLVEEIQAAFASPFGASGPGHTTGLVPDPGSVAGTTRYLREDATFQDPLGVADMLMPLHAAPIPIAGMTVMTATNFGCLHVCSGTAGDYNVTLPPVAGNAGKFVGLAMAPSLTRLVTVLRNASDLIDGATSRVMWANETATLLCDGTNWIKVAGKAIPMSCGLALAAAASVPSTTQTTVPFDTTLFDSTGLMADLVGHQVVFRRPGLYNLVVAATFYPSPVAGQYQVSATTVLPPTPTLATVTTVSMPNATASAVVGLTAPAPVFVTAANVTSGMTVVNQVFQYSGGTVSLYSPGCFLYVVEQPQW